MNSSAGWRSLLDNVSEYVAEDICNTVFESEKRFQKGVRKRELPACFKMTKLEYDKLSPEHVMLYYAPFKRAMRQYNINNQL